MGYHTKHIKKGVYGDISKIEEELEELKDAEQQSNKILSMVELSDLIGAIKGFVQKKYPFVSMEDLLKMSESTRSAFIDGTRK